MQMISNYSNIGFKSNLIKTKDVFIFTSISIILSSCSVHNNRSPAPIHGSSQSTNPYAKKPILTTIPLESDKQRPHLEEIEKVTSGNRVRNDLNRTHQEVRKPLSPAVLALVSEAEQNSKAGDLDSAVITIERALRIDSRNPTLTYKLAKLRLQQSKPRLAEDLAKKAAFLSANDKTLKRQSWLLISEARRQQKNYYGAKEAKLKAGEI